MSNQIQILKKIKQVSQTISCDIHILTMYLILIIVNAKVFFIIKQNIDGYPIRKRITLKLNEQHIRKILIKFAKILYSVFFVTHQNSKQMESEF